MFGRGCLDGRLIGQPFDGRGGGLADLGHQAAEVGFFDLAEAVSLIAANHLDESFLPLIHPWTHRDFIECLEEKRREDEYEAREDEP